MEDLAGQIEWLREHDDLARSIANAGRKYALENLMPKDVICYHALLLKSWTERLVNDPANQTLLLQNMVKVEKPKPGPRCQCYNKKRESLFKDEL